MVLRGRRRSEAARGFAARLSRAVPLEELLLQLAEWLRAHLDLVEAEVWTATDGHYERAVGVPHRTASPVVVDAEAVAVLARPVARGNHWLDVWAPALLAGRTGMQVRVAPAVHADEVFGFIVAVRREGARSFTTRDDALLCDLALQVGLSLRNLRLDTALAQSLAAIRRQAEELRASRARVVAAADAERRRIERDLHDGAQQRLLASVMEVRAARQALSTDPESVDRRLVDIEDAIETTIAEVRALAQGIYPPHLRSGGLSEALLVATRFTVPTALDVRVGRLAEPIEAAVYFCCLEALQNTGKHGGPAATARIEVVATDGDIVFTVEDDGVGFDPTSLDGSGSGLLNMRDRVGALGGELHVASASGTGTIVRGRLPMTGVEAFQPEAPAVPK